MKWNWFIGALVLMLAACGRDKKNEAQPAVTVAAPEPGMQAEPAATKDATPVSLEPAATKDATPASLESAPPPPATDWNAVAALLSGMPEKLPDSLSSVRNLAAFKTYVKQIDTMWIPVKKKKNIVEKWVKSELESVNRNCSLLFYPFSGPDFLHVHLLFPGCRSVVMIGLEPPGTLPEMARVLEHHPEKFFQKMTAALTHILTLSFFRTKSMKEDLFGKDVPEINGTLTLILFMMSRADYRIENIERVQLDANGHIVPWTGAAPDFPEIGKADAKSPRQTAGRHRKPRKPHIFKPFEGLRYTYRTPGETQTRTLTYFSCNLADGPYRTIDGITLRLDLQRFLKSLSISATYLKAASYLMHESGFSWIRNFILEHSPVILQDDSGIPLRFFDEKKWTLTLYGFYDVPIDIFLKYKQEDLARRYADRKSVKPLPFGIGYKVYPGRSNLQMAVRRR